MKQVLKNILVATDFSACGNNAISTAVSLCKKNNAALHLLHVIEKNQPATGDDYGNHNAATAHLVDHEAREQLYSIYESLIKDCAIHVHIYMPCGIAGDEICKIAGEMNMDLIVIGSHGRSGYSEFSMGSAANYVIQHVKKPVLTIPGNFESGQFLNILFPIRPVAALVEKCNFTLSLLDDKSCVHIAALCAEGEEEKLINYKHDFHQILLSMKQNGITCSKAVYCCRNLAHRVIDIGKRLAADLIVINTMVDPQPVHLFEAAYTQQLMNRAQVPVLSFRGAFS